MKICFPALLVAGTLAGTVLGWPPVGALTPHREVEHADDAGAGAAEGTTGDATEVTADDIAACEAYLEELAQARARLRAGLRAELPDLTAAFAEHDALVAHGSPAAQSWLARHRPRITAAALERGFHGHEVDHLFLTPPPPGGIHEVIGGGDLSVECVLGRSEGAGR